MLLPNAEGTVLLPNADSVVEVPNGEGAAEVWRMLLIVKDSMTFREKKSQAIKD